MSETMLFAADIGKLADVKNSALTAVKDLNSQTAFNIARQCIDHLDAAYLFLSQLGFFLGQLDKEAEKAVARATQDKPDIEFPRPPFAKTDVEDAPVGTDNGKA